MVVYILDKIEDIVHVIVSPLFIDLVDEEVSPSILGIPPVRNDNDHLLNFLGQDERIQGCPNVRVGETRNRHIVPAKEIENRIISCIASLISRREVDPKIHPPFQRRAIEGSHSHLTGVPEQLIRVRSIFSAREVV